MKIIVYIISLLLLVSFLVFSCRKNNDNNSDNRTEQPAEKIKLPLSGHYLWEFEIPQLGRQESNLIFYTDSIGYIMTGPAYTTDYVMIQESYTEKDDKKRWIGIGKGGSIPKDSIYFVMFLKDITDSTVTVYKRECKEGKEEAETFAYPADSATEDYGWNVYYKQ